MKRINKLCIIIGSLLGSYIPAGAQNISPVNELDTLIKTVLVHNRTLLSAREKYQVSLLEARTGLSPTDPTIEFGYLFGKPSDIGNRLDFGINQQFDFPTVYKHRSRVKQVKSGQAELLYISARQEIILQARLLWIERVSLNNHEILLSDRLREAEKMLEHYRRKLYTGEESKLVFSQANLQTVALQSELSRIRSKIRTNQIALEEITGGVAIQIMGLDYPPKTAFNGDSLLRDYSTSPQQQLYDRELELKEQQKNLAISNRLPKVSTGYYSESVLDQNFRGFQIGLTVPLWENAHRIKHAQSNINFAASDAARFSFVQSKEILQKLEQFHTMDEQVKTLEEALSLVNDQKLLSMALEAGEISLTEYLYGTDLYFRNVQSLLNYKRELLSLEAELFKIYY